ncbi:MAG: hypothetical protein ACE5H9_04365 [Anaerolineae bacterium]
MQRAWRILISFGLGLLLFLPVSGRGANLLSNDGLEAPFVQYGTYTNSGVDWKLQVAHDWEKFIILDNTYKDGQRLRFFSASDWAAFNGSPFVEKRDGSDAQVWWSSRKFDAGVYQQITGLTVGEVYGFQAGTLQVWETTGSQTHGKMFRSVGIDPFGGTDPTSPNVLWSPEESLDVDWFYPGVGAQAMAGTMTVFVRVRSPERASTPNSNQVWVDDTFLDLAPTTSLTLTADSPTQVTATWSGTPRAGFHLFAYEAQYRKATDSSWTDLQVFDSSTDPVPTGSSGQFTVEPGLEYIVRARTWHEQDGGDSHEVPGPWTEQSIVAGGLVSGRVLSNREQGVIGVTVQVSGALTATTSDGAGAYSLFTGPGGFSLTTTASSGWTNPQPVQATVANTATTPLSITLRPPDDIITNGDFESGANGWNLSGSSPATVTTGHRSGAASLQLSGTASLSQTGLISDSYQPVLSFWYNVVSGSPGNFTAEILGTDGLTVTNAFTPSIGGGWQHAWLPLGLTEVYTGQVGVRFRLNPSGPATVVSLDEVSLGGSWGGPRRAYLPSIYK